MTDWPFVRSKTAARSTLSHCHAVRPIICYHSLCANTVDDIHNLYCTRVVELLTMMCCCYCDAITDLSCNNPKTECQAIAASNPDRALARFCCCCCCVSAFSIPRRLARQLRSPNAWNNGGDVRSRLRISASHSPSHTRTTTPPRKCGVRPIRERTSICEIMRTSPRHLCVCVCVYVSVSNCTVTSRFRSGSTPPSSRRGAQKSNAFICVYSRWPAHAHFAQTQLTHASTRIHLAYTRTH